MTHDLAMFAGYAISLPLGLGLLAITIIAARSLLSDLWKFFFVYELRSRLDAASMIFGFSVVPPMVLYLAFFRSEGPQVAVFLCFAMVPTSAWHGLAWWAWIRDDRATRLAALEIAIERAERYREPPPRIDQKTPWKDYVFDVETARRRLEYEPPPI